MKKIKDYLNERPISKRVVATINVATPEYDNTKKFLGIELQKIEKMFKKAKIEGTINWRIE